MRPLFLAFLLTTAIHAQSVGDYTVPYKANSTGPATEKHWAGGNSKLWGTNSSGNPVSITLGTGLSFSGSTLNVSGGGSGGASAWGEITGTLADQTDLQSALNAKLSTTTAASTYEPLITVGSLALNKLATDPLARANHTGTQDVSTITGLGTLATANTVGLSSVINTTSSFDRVWGQLGSATSGSAWLLGSGLAVSGSVTKTLGISDGGITNTMLAGSIALSKLATDPLARANHTGTQAWSTITGTPTTLSGYGITDAVAGPASVVDNALARFDGTTGKLVQSHSNTTLSDNGNLYLSGADASFQYEAYAASMFIEHLLNEARLRWLWSDGDAAYNEFALKLDTTAGSQGLESSIAYWLPQSEPGGTGEVLSVASIDSNGEYHLSWTSAGAGDVVGPVSSTSGHVATFNGTTGKLLASTSIASVLEGLSTTQGAIAYRGASTWTVLSPGTANQVLQTGGAGANPSWTGGRDVWIVACSDETTALTTGTAKVTFRAPRAATVTAVRLSVGTAPTGATFVVDINEAGTTILSTKLSVDVSETTSTTAATAAVISDSAIADDAQITIDFDQVGSTIAGAGAKVAIYVTY